MAQGFIRQHRSQLFENEVQVEQKKNRRDDEDQNHRGKKNLLVHFIIPKKKRTETEVDKAEQFRAVKRVAPGTFLCLKSAHLPQAEKQQAVGRKRENHIGCLQ